jgi:hypothetical protein
MLRSIEPGTPIGRLTVVHRLSGPGKARYKVRCRCGTEKVMFACNLASGQVVSCGCARWDPHTKVPDPRRAVMRAVWRAMLAQRVGGVRVCTYWLKSFDSFLAVVGYQPSPSHILGRRDESGYYTAPNTVWVLRPGVEVAA